MHVVYICVSVLMNYDCTTHPILPFITKFLSKHCIKRVLDTEMNGYHFQFYRKTFLGSVDATKKCKIFTLIVWLFRGGAKSLRGGEHLPTPPLKIRPCYLWYVGRKLSHSAWSSYLDGVIEDSSSPIVSITLLPQIQSPTDIPIPP
jgi:hypothetical protein